MVLRIIVIAIEILICFLLQTTVFQWFVLAGTVPNLLLIITVTYGFLRGKKVGIGVGIICGLLVDFMYGDIIGVYAIFYMLIGYGNGFCGKIFNKSDKVVPIVLVGFSQFVYFILYYTFNFLLRGKLNIFFYFTTIGLPEIVYTTIASIFVYRIFYNIDNKIDDLYKKEA